MKDEAEPDLARSSFILHPSAFRKEVLMCRAPRRALPALLALALAWPAPARPEEGPDRPAVVTPSPGQAELERMKVELAWLADPATFALPLEAHLKDGITLEVCGTVPDGRARER